VSRNPEQTESDLLVTNIGAGVRLLTLNRPERSNAISPELNRKIVSETLAACDDSAVRVLVFTGAGTRAFSAGGDLKAASERDQRGSAAKNPLASAERLLFEVVADVPIPTIAAINGSAVGGGLELALACDLRIASSEAQLGLPEARRGMAANFASVVLPRLIPPGIAFEMLYTGEYIDAARALELGVVNRVVPAAQVLDTALALASTIAGNAPISVRRIKATVTKSASLPLAAALRLDVGPNPYVSEDRKEGARAFVEKRPPVWQDR
jgi:enoyl-CoA hydratase